MKKNRSLSSFIKLPIYSLFFAFIAWSAYWFLGTIYIENKVLENNNIEKKEVTIGIRNEGLVEILSGLDEGDTIVAAGLKKVNPKGKIKPIKK